MNDCLDNVGFHRGQMQLLFENWYRRNMGGNEREKIEIKIPKNEIEWEI